MTTVRSGAIGLGEARDRIARMIREHAGAVEQICRRHGAIIEAKAAQITPVDTGFLRRANAHKVERETAGVVLTVENRMSYAVYQHNIPFRHKQPGARDHFIALPFGAELPMLVKDIIDKDMEAAT